MAASGGFGSSSWWGFSPALDLTSLQTPATDNDQQDDEVVNILLVGASDLRHVLRTISGSNGKRNNNKVYQFFMIEGHLECYARHMLFLYILSQPKTTLGIRERSELFLELYGNTCIRSQTAQYVREAANELIKLITDSDYMQSTLPVLNVSLLKFKERDMLEGIFKFWRNQDQDLFDIKKHWDGRLRHYLAQRYDARLGVFDWDYHMKLGEMAPTISSKEYKEWREAGVAFRLRDDAPYDISNKTLASGMILRQSGETICRRGYHGDIVTSPYVSLGTHCDNQDLLKTANGKYVKSCQQICEYNIQQLIGLSVFGCAPPTSLEGPPLYPGGVSVIVEEVEEEGAGDDDSVGPLFNGSCKIHLLPLLYASEIGKKAKFCNFFHYAYFSNSMVHHLSSGIETTLRDDTVLICETARYMLDLRKEHTEQYMEKVKGMAKSVGFTVQPELAAEHAIAVFTRLDGIQP